MARKIRADSTAKTLPTGDARVLAARAKVVVIWERLESWRDVAAWCGNHYGHGAYQRLGRDPEFRPPALLVEQVAACALPPVQVALDDQTVRRLDELRYAEESREQALRRLLLGA